MDRDQIAHMLKTGWSIVVFRSILMIILGLLFLFKTGPAIGGLILYLGIFWLIDGLITTFQSIRFRAELPHWGWALFSGIISILGGGILIARPAIGALVATTTFVYIVGFIMIMAATMSIVAGIRLRKEIKHEWALILLGVTWLGLAIVFMSNPMMTGYVLAKTLGAFALVFGILILVKAIQAKKKFPEIEERMHQLLKDW